MRLVTTTQVSLDGVMQGMGGSSEDRRGGFERGGWARPLGDSESGVLVPGSGALVRWLLAHGLVDELELMILPVVVGQGMRLFPESGPDLALEVISSRVTPSGVAIVSYRPAGTPRYAG